MHGLAASNAEMRSLRYCFSTLNRSFISCIQSSSNFHLCSIAHQCSLHNFSNASSFSTSARSIELSVSLVSQCLILLLSFVLCFVGFTNSILPLSIQSIQLDVFCAIKCLARESSASNWANLSSSCCLILMVASQTSPEHNDFLVTTSRGPLNSCRDSQLLSSWQGHHLSHHTESQHVCECECVHACVH